MEWVSVHRGGLCLEGRGSLSRWGHCSEGVFVQGVPFKWRSSRGAFVQRRSLIRGWFLSKGEGFFVQMGGGFLSRKEPPGQNDTCL